MSIFSGVNNPGLDFNPFLASEMEFIQNLAGLAYEQGDIIYHNGTSLTRLAAGTNGHFLKTQGPNANPVWAAASGSAINFGDNETPAGTFDGVNDDFTLANAPNPANSLMLYLNGVFQTQGSDYTLSSLTITFTTPPDAGFSGLPFKAFYRY